MSILSFNELIEKSIKENKAIYEIALDEEKFLTDDVIEVIRLRVLENLIAMREAIKIGLTSNEKAISGWCGDDCVKLVERFKNKPSLFGKLFEKIITLASENGI